MPVLLETITLTHQDIQKARQAVSALSEGNLEMSQLPEAARRLLAHILNEFADGHALSVVPARTDLTTSQAAHLLNVSRPYLVKLLQEGKLPFHRVGSHKRVLKQDVEVYQKHQKEQSYAALADLQAQAQELDMGY